MNRVEQEAPGRQKEKARETKKPPIPVFLLVQKISEAETSGGLSPLPSQNAVTRR